MIDEAVVLKLESELAHYRDENQKLRNAAVLAIQGMIPWSLMTTSLPKGELLVMSPQSPASGIWELKQESRDKISAAIKGLNLAVYPKGFPEEAP